MQDGKNLWCTYSIMSYNHLHLREDYDARVPTFVRAAKNISEAISLMLETAELRPLAITHRIKTFDSFFEKVTRKNYENPFEQNTDFVGIRVICYLPSDADVVVKILGQRLDVIESVNKSENLEPNEFGYRSHHLLLRVPSSWEQTPNYYGLRATPVEVQVRTIMMHAWAEIEHKLQYKSTNQVPGKLQRKLFLLSAKVEEVDEQFQELVVEVTKYRREISDTVITKNDFNTSLELNLDTLEKFIEFCYPGRAGHKKMTQDIFETVIKFNLTLNDLMEMVKKFKPLEDLRDSLVSSLNAPASLSYVLDVFQEGYTKTYTPATDRLAVINKLKQAYEDQNKSK